MSNLTQSIYFIGDLVCFFVIYGFASTQNGHRVLGKAAIDVRNRQPDLRGARYRHLHDRYGGVVHADPQRHLFDVERLRILPDSSELSDRLPRRPHSARMTLGYFAFTGKLWLLGVYPRVYGPARAIVPVGSGFFDVDDRVCRPVGAVVGWLSGHADAGAAAAGNTLHDRLSRGCSLHRLRCP